MGKIQSMLPKLIVEAMKEKNTFKKNAYTNLKTAFLNYTTSKEGVKECTVDENGARIIPDAKELAIVKKMHTELVENGKQYNMNDYLEEAKYYEPFIPQSASKEEVATAIERYIAENGAYDQKQMGLVIKYVKSQFENVDGALVASEVKARIS